MREIIIDVTKLDERAKVAGASVEAFAPYGVRRLSVQRFLRDGEELVIQRMGAELRAVLRSPESLPSFEPTFALGDPAMDVMSNIAADTEPRPAALPFVMKADPDANKGDIRTDCPRCTWQAATADKSVPARWHTFCPVCNWPGDDSREADVWP